MDYKIALDVWIEISMTRVIGMQNKLLDFMSLQEQIKHGTLELEDSKDQHIPWEMVQYNTERCPVPVHQIRCPNHG